MSPIPDAPRGPFPFCHPSLRPEVGIRTGTLTPVPDRNPFLRELLITFGASGYVALYEIEDELTITILAVRHPRENDYH